jgi:leucine dehydrogenase
MLFDSADFAGHEQVVFVSDRESGLKAIIAIHSTKLGPAAGGCRILPYPDDMAALTDVLRLSQGMTFKNAMAGLPLGGGKSVIIADPDSDKTAALLQAMGRAIEGLGGLYFTGEDVGTSTADMLEIRKTTRYAVGLPVDAGGTGDPSPSTALGCLEGIRAAVSYKLAKASLRGVRVAIQGLGHVGMNLAKLLVEDGAQLIVSDVRKASVDAAVRELGAITADPEDIYDIDAEVFAPCALGAVINDWTLPRIKAKIIAGAANNQLAKPAHGRRLQERGILYAPDYVINAGGIIQLSAEITGDSWETIERRVRAIGATLLTVFQTADAERLSTSAAADRIAAERIEMRANDRC